MDMDMKARAATLLDFNQKLDINLLDSVVNCMYSGVGEQVRFGLFLSFIFNVLILEKPIII